MTKNVDIAEVLSYNTVDINIYINTNDIFKTIRKTRCDRCQTRREFLLTVD